MTESGRYSRQVLLSHIGEAGQQRMARGSALVLGCGGLGTVSANLLVRAGVGRAVVVDRDVVDLENLQRQVLYGERDVGRPKAEVAAEMLRAANSEVAIDSITADVNPYNIEALIEDMDVVVDGTDNLETRFLLNDACVKHSIPWVYGGAVETSGMVMSVLPGGPCFRCVFPGLPPPGSLPTCDTAGVLNALPGLIASIQATEAVKILLGDRPCTDLLVWDLWDWDVQRVKVERREDCDCCGSGRYEYLETARGKTVTTLCGRNAVQVVPKEGTHVSLDGLAERLARAGDVEGGGSVLYFRTDGYEFIVFKDGRAIIKGCEDEARARALYSKYIGD